MLGDLRPAADRHHGGPGRIRRIDRRAFEDADIVVVVAIGAAAVLEEHQDDGSSARLTIWIGVIQVCKRKARVPGTRDRQSAIAR